MTIKPRALPMSDGDKGYICGVLYAVALLQRHGGMSAEELLKESGITLEDARAAEVDPYDLKPCRGLWASLKERACPRRLFGTFRKETP